VLGEPVRERRQRALRGVTGDWLNLDEDVTPGPLREARADADLVAGKGHTVDGDDRELVGARAFGPWERAHVDHGATLGDARETRGSLPVLGAGPNLAHVMLLMFVVWLVVFIGIFRGWRWVPLLALANLAYTLLVLRIHMTDPIPLNF
jgi:hypothetical protein